MIAKYIIELYDFIITNSFLDLIERFYSIFFNIYLFKLCFNNIYELLEYIYIINHIF